MPILDPDVYTANSTYHRSPCLFSVGGFFLSLLSRSGGDFVAVAALGIRLLSEKPSAHATALGIARNTCAQVLVNGGVAAQLSLAQAFLLLSVFEGPTAGGEERRGRTFAGIAARCDCSTCRGLGAHTFQYCGRPGRVRPRRARAIGSRPAFHGVSCGGPDRTSQREAWSV
jgi:hypothetical protein